MKLIKHSEHITIIEEFWTPEKCDKFISNSENIGYEPAMVQTENGQKIVESVRNNQRILFKDLTLAESIWNNAKEFANLKLGNSNAIGLNEMFRFYKYEKNQEFKKHRDQSYIRNELESSFYTLMIYLNDNFEGGETTFGDLKISPKKGSCLIFFHDLEHEGSKLISGKKYILRTDVMYRFEEK
ncbi:Poxvirus C4/C10 protein [Bernardetia litoralis DSM 6794]|uniref:Poxvirus C4/C10 protein n=1 Tax=Bernardetia litoralis (strain ATCC 23117 / DSM 6794 / NBRC 15988 / NCIMB 1366 / Fx l1 / Sio-4) TaxID=880071 RepID=I4ALA3_BERLS|nr:2OG-Fe(II) oxygenase [Bernardetia litoralis]AFM04738.1 Poxvirus C4/C10 protein [Bernardetia litoralis DSM 6794]